MAVLLDGQKLEVLLVIDMTLVLGFFDQSYKTNQQLQAVSRILEGGDYRHCCIAGNQIQVKGLLQERCHILTWSMVLLMWFGNRTRLTEAASQLFQCCQLGAPDKTAAPLHSLASFLNKGTRYSA